MGLTSIDQNTDLDNIFLDLAASGAIEQLTVDGDATEYDVIRFSKLTAEQLRDTGWALEYKFSVLIKRSSAPTLILKQIITLSTSGQMRILDLAEGPTLIYTRLDLGALFGSDST